MPVPAQPEPIAERNRRLQTFLTHDPTLVREAQALRYRIFAEEMGARLHSPEAGLDIDNIDPYCDHLIVYDTQRRRVAGCTRLLTDAQAARFGRFYSESEFVLEQVLRLPGRFLEIGRTCVDPRYRGGVVISALWGGLAEHVAAERFDFLMGCASIPPGPSGFSVDAFRARLTPEQIGPAEFAVRPRLPVPADRRCQRDESGVPPLLQAYLRLGAWVCGEPCWDPDFNVMDVFILLSLPRLAERYGRHFFLARESTDATTAASL